MSKKLISLVYFSFKKNYYIYKDNYKKFNFNPNFIYNNNSKSLCTTIQNTKQSLDQEEKITEESFNNIEKLGPEDLKKLKVLKLEYDVLFSSGVRLPLRMTDKNWAHIFLKCPSIASRKKYYDFLFKKEKYKESAIKRIETNKQIQEEKRAKVNEMRKLGLLESFKNTFLIFLQDPTMNKFYHTRLYHSILLGEATKLVFDFSFEKNMTQIELQNLLIQIQLCYAINKVSKEPFHFHFCNLDNTSETATYLYKSIPNIEEIPIDVTAKSYLDIFPKEKLIYLSPNAPTVLTKFEHDAIYIIGCIVDKGIELPLTMAKAKRENIRMAKLPIDHYIKWMQGSKALPLNHLIEVLLDYKENNNWKDALIKHLPKRKVTEIKPEDFKKNMSRKNYYKLKNRKMLDIFE